MIQRGRKSKTALSLVPAVLPGQRHRAPAVLNVTEAALWKSVVATKPADWFTEDSHPLLVAYCRASVMADQLSKEIDMLPKLDAITEDNAALAVKLFGMRKDLLKSRSAEVDKLVSLARSMRLSQQARMRPEVGGTAHKRANGTTGETQRKPWEVD